MSTSSHAVDPRRRVPPARRASPPPPAPSDPAALVGDAPAWRDALDLIDRVAASKATVLLTGESGTGKEIVARALHARSPRAHAPFVAVHCAALPSTLLEAEMFGHDAGAFTGAVGRRTGRFEEADGGTLFLDEVGEIPPETQVKLLRAIQERKIERLGGQRPIRVDIRLVAATHNDLKAEIASGRFREDLYYRLKVIEVRLPPLRERPGDIPILARSFLERFAAQNGKPRLRGFDDAATRLLESYAWPGNVRELENVVERAAILARDEVVRAHDLPLEVREPAPSGSTRDGYLVPRDASLDEAERIVIEGALARADGDKDEAARLLGIGARTIYRRLKSWKARASQRPS